MSDSTRNASSLRPALALVLGVLVIYAATLTFGFVDYDDDRYVTANPAVQSGMTAAGVQWAFSSTWASNWHPVTWLSHMLDVQLFGLWAGGHHATNTLLHATNAVLFFLFVLRATGRTGAAFLAAALFAWHPLRVESVAWIAERKELLATLFGLVALLAYVGWARQGGGKRLALVILAFALGVMSKPMLVTLPCVLLLLDRWPLRRSLPWSRLVLEKLPLFALAGLSAAMTLSAQSASGATRLLRDLPPGARLANAFAALQRYVEATLAPHDLAALYPHPALFGESAGLRAWLGAALVVLGLALGVLWRTRRPYVLVGWLWTLGTLVPVIGLVQVGYQSHADRYTYFSFLGFALLAGCALVELPLRRRTLRLACGTGLVLLAGLSLRQVSSWRDSEALWERCLAVDQRNFVAHSNLGKLAAEGGELTRAQRHLEHSVALFEGGPPPDPESAARFANLAAVFGMQGRIADALPSLERAAELDPTELDVRANLGRALQEVGRDAEAVRVLAGLLRDSPRRLDVQDLLAWVLATSRDDAVRDGGEALRLTRAAIAAAGPSGAVFRPTLAAALAEVGEYARAIDIQAALIGEAPPGSRAELEARLAAFRARRPWRKTP